MRFSVVMPVYNGEKTIGNAIKSVLDQTYIDWELVIVNDGSTDKTEDIVKQFKDDRIKYFRFENNQGIVMARNYGNKMATGEWLVMQDADDLSLPNRLEKVAGELVGDVVYHGLYMNVWDTQYGCISRKYIPAPVFNKERILKEQYIPGVVFFKKSLWERRPFREETEHAFDWMMHVDWIMSDAKYHRIDEGLYEYVRHENSASITYEKDGRRAESMGKIKEIIKTYA